MRNILAQTICRVGIFMICAQAIVHFRPQEAYEKYLKLLVSVMILIQLFLPVGSFFLGGGMEETVRRLELFRAELEQEMETAVQEAAEADRMLEQMTLEEIRRRMEEISGEEEQESGEGTEGSRGAGSGGGIEGSKGTGSGGGTEGSKGAESGGGTEGSKGTGSGEGTEGSKGVESGETGVERQGVVQEVTLPEIAVTVEPVGE